MKSVSLAVLVIALAVGCASASRSWVHNGKHYNGELSATTNVTGLCGSTESFTGYYQIQGGKDKQYFYWFFEAQQNPDKAPVVLWMTGGPGCSSELALLFENGPCTPNADGKTTTPNPYSWNQQANLLYIDQPAGVGFSTGAHGDADSNEKEVAEDMYNFLHDFFSGNPDLQNRPLYIFGESYGGHFAPATAARVGQTLNLQGLGVGNGLTDPLVQYQYYPDLAYTWAQQKLGHPVISKAQYDAMNAGWPACREKIARCQNNTVSCPSAQASCNNLMLAPYEETGLNPYDIRRQCGPNPLCYDMSNVTKFLTNPEIVRRLGVLPGLTWESCNYTVNAMFSADWMKDFQQDLASVLTFGRVLIYAGDVDFICNWIGNKNMALQFSWPGHDDFNAASDKDWSVQGQVAGQLRSADKLSFLQVYDAGHMVPHDKPLQAQVMVNSFISNSL